MRFALLPLALALPLVAAARAGHVSEDSVPAGSPVDATERNAVPVQTPFELTLGGRLHVHVSRHRGDDPPARATDGADLRRARIKLSGRLDGDWSFTAEVDAADPDQPVRDFWLRYDGFDGIGITAGHVKQPYSLALETSSNDLPFVERGIDAALIAPFVDRAVGVRIDLSRGRWFAAAGVYGERAGESGSGWGTTARFVYAPVAETSRVVHLAVRAAYREPDAAAEPVRIRDETTDFSSLHIVDTGPLADVERVVLVGPEAALVSGPFSLFAEYTLADVDRGASSASFDAWHIGAAWTIGGESRADAYSLESGKFQRLQPTRAFSRGAGGGTWELVARYASLDLNDGAFVGGDEERLTLGANWYVNRHVRTMLDWSRIVDTDESNAVRAAAVGLDVITLRAELSF
ncbi:MAG: porin [Gammaproteobacteria bacterium]